MGISTDLSRWIMTGGKESGRNIGSFDFAMEIKALLDFCRQTKDHDVLVYVQTLCDKLLQENAHNHNDSVFFGQSSPIWGLALCNLSEWLAQEKYLHATEGLLKRYENNAPAKQNSSLTPPLSSGIFSMEYLAASVFLAKSANILKRPDLFDLSAAYMKRIFCIPKEERTGLPLLNEGSEEGIPLPSFAADSSQVISARSLALFAMACAETLSLLPKNHEQFVSLTNDFFQLMGFILNARNARDGLWRKNLSQPLSLENCTDYSSSALFTYTILLGAREGLLSAGMADAAKKSFQMIEHNQNPADLIKNDVRAAAPLLLAAIQAEYPASIKPSFSLAHFATDSFYKLLYEHKRIGEDFLACPKHNFSAFLQQKRTLLREVLRVPQMEALLISAGDSRVEWLETRSHEDVSIMIHSLEVLPDLFVPLYVLQPDHPQCDVHGIHTILYCQPHGTTFTQSLMKQSSNTPLACRDTFELQLARAGYRVIIPELVGFGASKRSVYKDPDFATCYANSAELLLHGLNIAGVRVFSLIAALDYACSLQDTGRIIGYGMSGGGLVLTLLSALEERLHGAVIASYLNVFADSIGAMRHCIDNYIPDILRVGDAAHLLALSAPRPLLISAGTDDPLFPLYATEKAIQTVKTLYEKCKAENHIDVEIFHGGHVISNDRVFDWLRITFADTHNNDTY